VTTHIIYQVDAFTSRLFGGNPAAVCILDSWLDAEVMQDIAAENNLSETAFIVQSHSGYDLRWFTPTIEVDLCGHATLAAGYVVLHLLSRDSDSVSFETVSGTLTVRRDGEWLSMDFPSRVPTLVPAIEALSNALGKAPSEVHMSRDILALYDDEATVQALSPDFVKLAALEEGLGVVATAQGDNVDFVSRFFAPKAGISEDPVTGSAHCILIPFWSERLGRSQLQARQISERGGELLCEHRGDRVTIQGQCRLFLQGTFEFESHNP
jgi:PhzF family phenazine biosynthesis protein